VANDNKNNAKNVSKYTTKVVAEDELKKCYIEYDKE